MVVEVDCDQIFDPAFSLGGGSNESADAFYPCAHGIVVLVYLLYDQTVVGILCGVGVD